MLGLGILILVVAGIASLIGTVMFIVAAFRVSLVWGLLVLFVPFAGLVFLIKYWPQAKRGFVISLAGSAVAGIGFFVMAAGAASSAHAQFKIAAGQMRTETTRQQKATRQAETGEDSGGISAEPAVLRLDAAPAAPASRQASPSASRPAAWQRGLADLSLDDADPLDVRPKDLTRHVGEDLLFVQKDGGKIWGRLVSVSPNSLAIERRLHGGSVQYDLARADLRAVRTDD
jgi:hypothetical protein